MVTDMNIQIYADGADIKTMAALARDDRISGFTTNPSLCRKAGVTDYRDFAKQVLAVVGGKPVSFEVFSDDMGGMERQAREIASWGKNIYVKVPITNTIGEYTLEVIERLTLEGIKLNVTAIFTLDQIRAAIEALGGASGIISIFAGRIADTGRDPVQIVRYAVGKTRNGKTKVLWASTREVYNVVQADECGCDIITCTPDIISKLGGIGGDLTQRSLETVKEFFNDGKGYSLLNLKAKNGFG